MTSLRILSLLPAATEIVYLLGLEKYLVGVSDEVTSSPVSNKMSSGEINRLVGKLIHQGPGVFHIKKDQLKKLKPDLIITQELCQVCAIPFTQVQKAARILDGQVKIVSLEPESVSDILDNIRVVGEFGGKKEEANRVIRQLKERLDKIKRKIATPPSVARNDRKVPKVLVIEWLDPVMVAGHWVPEMVGLAGGKMMLTKTGEKSRRINLAQKPVNPDIVIISPCGFDIKRILQEKKLILSIVREIREVRGGVYLVDGNSYMTRPGPRIVDGIEILSEIIHPEIFPKKHSENDWREF